MNAVFQRKGCKYYYDNELWELVDVSNERLRVDCHKTLRYIGPIVEGSIVGKVPKFPIYERTFEGLTRLIHVPDGTSRWNSYEMFKGCINLQPSLEEMIKIWNMSGSGAVSPLFENCNSPHIIDIKHATVKDCFPQSSQVGPVNKFLNTVDYESLSELLVENELLVFTDGTTICSCDADNLDVLKDSTRVCGSVVIKSCPSYSRIKSNITVFYKVSRELAEKSDNPILLRMYGIGLHGKVLTSSYCCGEDYTLEVSGTNSITSPVCPLIASGTLTIKGSGELIIKCTDNMHACIGIETNTGMSYGRWEPGYGYLDKLIIDGVKVICESSVPDFSLGSYGESDIPEIILLNGGKLICPETSGGERVMIKSGAEGLFGSTKRENRAVYKMVKFEPLSYLKENYPDDCKLLPTSSICRCHSAEDCDELIRRLKCGQ